MNGRSKRDDAGFPRAGEKLRGLRQDFRLWLQIWRIRLAVRDASPAALLRGRLSALWRSGGKRFRVSWGLAVCAIVSAAAILLSALAQGAPQLRSLTGAPARAEGIAVLDPYEKDETLLSPGYLYDRPIAAVQTGTQRLLLRLRLEETLLTVRRDEKGLVIVTKESREPGDHFIPRTLSRAAALQLLREGGYCAQGGSWETALAAKLPADRLPGQTDANGMLLIFEKKQVQTNTNVPLPDIKSLLPEDVEALGLVKTTYSFLGFLQRGTGDDALYQPLQLQAQTPEQTEEGAAGPKITKIFYQFFQWDAAQREVHVFGKEAGPVKLEANGLLPLREWKSPAALWYYDEDGWLYYGKVLEPGEMTPLLLEHFSVGPDSPLVEDETRYRLFVRVQAALPERNAVLDGWNSGASLDGLGSSSMSNAAANFAASILELEG